jgi:uncharacterized protein (DUF433 family)
MLLVDRIVCDPRSFGGQPIIRKRRLVVDHVLGMLAAGDALEKFMSGYPWMEHEDVLACLAYPKRPVGHERDPPGPRVDLATQVMLAGPWPPFYSSTSRPASGSRPGGRSHRNRTPTTPAIGAPGA